jgi:hypothetical protein
VEQVNKKLYVSYGPEGCIIDAMPLQQQMLGGAEYIKILL